jgi:hypothetical protein
MLKKRDNRVLNRRGAREVTDEEIRRIVGNGGALVPTRLTDFMTGTPSSPDHTFDE